MDRKEPQFNNLGIGTGAHMLRREINLLNKRRWNFEDESIIISANLRLRQDGLPYSDQAEPSDPAVAVYFNLRFWRNGKEYSRHVVLSCDRWKKVGWNIHALVKDIEAQRGRERWGCTSIEQAFQGYLAIPERCGVLPWWEILGVKPEVAEADLKEAFRLLAKTHHPDVGGDRKKWDELQEAYEQALAKFRPAI